MTRPTVIVEISFPAGAADTAFILDDVTRGVLDTSTLGVADYWTDVTAYVSSVDISRGRQRLLDRHQTGTCNITLDNSDRRFDPTNLAGPYVTAGVTNVRPNRKVRVRAEYAGTVYYLFQGYVDRWDIDWQSIEQSTAVAQCSDGFKMLANFDGTEQVSQGASEDSGARINRILDNAGWPTEDRNIDTGIGTCQATTLAQSALTELYLTTDSEYGQLYITGDGKVRFRNRHAYLTDARSTTSQATFGDDTAGTELDYSDLKISYDDQTVVNYAAIGRVGGTQQVAEDLTSQTTNLLRSQNRTDLIFETDSVAADYANWIIYQFADAELRFDEMTVQADTNDAWPEVLDREFGDRITVIKRPPGGGTITREVFVEGITHSITPLPGTGEWVTKFKLASTQRGNGFILDSVTHGVLDSSVLVF